MPQPKDILDAARDIRPHLPDLIGEDASAVDQKLEELLQTADSNRSVGLHIRLLLKPYEAAQTWIAEYLGESTQSEQETPRTGTKGISPLAGNIGIVASRQYQCPVPGCSETWIQRRAGQAPPNCPIHGVPLEPVPNS